MKPTMWMSPGRSTTRLPNASTRRQKTQASSTTPARSVPELSADGEKVVAVYLPMSYQIGGYTVYLPERYLRRLVMPVEEAMRMVLTAGMNRPREDGTRARDSA